MKESEKKLPPSQTKANVTRAMTTPSEQNVPARYPLKVQAIRSRGQQPRLYVYFPLPLAAAIGLAAGEQVEWELLDRGELHLVRQQIPAVRARRLPR